jgi:hypothetical protein
MAHATMKWHMMAEPGCVFQLRALAMGRTSSDHVRAHARRIGRLSGLRAMPPAAAWRGDMDLV